MRIKINKYKIYREKANYYIHGQQIISDPVISERKAREV